MVIAIKDFIVSEETNEQESPNDVLYPEDAAAYLERLWNRPFTSKDFNNFRTNHAKELASLDIKPVSRKQFMTSWRRSDLDIIAEKFDAPRLRTEIRKPRPKRSQSE